MLRIAACALAGCSFSPGITADARTDRDAGDSFGSDAAGSDAPGSDAGAGDAATMPNMVLVPGGPFMRGCNSAFDSMCEADESPYRAIMISEFWIDRTEVTFGAWMACVNAAACAPTTNPGGDDRPVSVSRAQAQVYCAFAGKRLPTEAEWEKAARGTDGRTYPWGNANLDCQHANISGCGGVVLAVGSLPMGASPYGALDMLGNVWEWVLDSYDAGYYAVAPDSDPQGPPANTQAIRRGGGTASDAIGARVANRGWNVPGAGDHGVRCAK